MRIKHAPLKPAKLLLLTIFSVMANSANADFYQPASALLQQEPLPLTVAPASAQSVSGLAGALRATMAHNPAIKGKKAELDAQQYGVASAKAKRYPTLSAQANNINDDYDQATVRLDQPVWAFGKIDAAIDQAQASVDAEQWSLLQVQRQLLEDTAAVYAKIDGIKQRVQVAQTNIDEHQRLYQRIERRQQGQLSSEADVRLAYSRLLQAQTQRQRIEGELLVADTELHALTQIKVSTAVAVEPRLVQLPSYAEVERLALEKEANVSFKRQRLKVVRLDLTQEKLASLPTVYLRVEHDVLDNLPNVDTTRAGLTFESSFEGLGFVARGRVKGAEARLAAAQYDLDNSLNDVRRRVNTLMLNRRVQQSLIAAQQNTVDAVAATMASFLRQYETGRKSWVEVLNTQRELTELRSQLVQIKNDWLILSLRVASLAGGLDQQAGLAIDDK